MVALALQASASHGKCDPRFFTAIVKKLIPQRLKEDEFQKYYQDRRPSGWSELIEEFRRSNPRSIERLGGNKEGAERLTLSDGSSVVFKDFMSFPETQIKKIVNQLEEWAKGGYGPKVLGLSLREGLNPEEKKFLLVMEDLFAKENEFGKTLISGDGIELRLLRKEPPEARLWLMRQMLSRLETHPDPHPLNVVFRVTQTTDNLPRPVPGSFLQVGEKIYQAFLVDPSGERGKPDHPLFNTELSQTPQPLLQYNREWKTKFFKKELDL